MANREAFVTYLLDTAAQSREPNARARGFSSAVDTARSLELLANLVLSLPEHDERLQMLASLTVCEHRFTPGAATEQRDQTLVRSVAPSVQRVSQHPGSNCEGRRPGARPLAGIPASQAPALNRANRYTFSDRRKVSIAENRAAWDSIDLRVDPHRPGASRIPALAGVSSTPHRPAGFLQVPASRHLPQGKDGALPYILAAGRLHIPVWGTRGAKQSAMNQDPLQLQGGAHSTVFDAQSLDRERHSPRTAVPIVETNC